MNADKCRRKLCNLTVDFNGLYIYLPRIHIFLKMNCDHPLGIIYFHIPGTFDFDRHDIRHNDRIWKVVGNAAGKCEQRRNQIYKSFLHPKNVL